MRVTRQKGPLYSQIRDILRDRILHGVYAKGENIPSEPDLEKEFEVSKITVRSAIKELVQEGYLEAKSGKGTRVIRNRAATKLSRGKKFTETLVEQGHKINKRILEVKELQNSPETNLYHMFGERCLCIERVYDLDGKPYIYYRHYFLRDTLPKDMTLSKDQSLYQLVEDHDIMMKTFKDAFDVVEVPPYAATKLEVEPNRPILQRERYTYDERDRLIEYSEGYYNTSLQKYLIHYDA